MDCDLWHAADRRNLAELTASLDDGADSISISISYDNEVERTC